jgi:hypothetical protein
MIFKVKFNYEKLNTLNLDLSISDMKGDIESDTDK